MEILRYTAFSTDPAGGNRAGVVLDATGADDAAMLATAAEIGYSETAFVFPRPDGELDVKYFSPLAEVPFCGHATIATAVAYAERHGVGELTLHTRAGVITVSTDRDTDGSIVATLVSAPPSSEELPSDNLDQILSALGWDASDLDPQLPPRVAYAGARHPIIAAATRQRLSDLDYDFEALSKLMEREDWTTVDLVWRESDTVFHARNPFPPGGIVEDPVTGAAAAAFGGYLRELKLVDTPASLTVYQGQDLGRPGTITVTVPAEPDTGIGVTGTAVAI
ncbi:PhzF family phenazine biosynthesis protein [Stackebrandtia nassauensis]|uniref:Phenazine biosynthesis protein PhzF family n=1 Tax=Stackebrandtia nassauensis (strain DSM 44728 / CIP 108903 / NRRL B-16338 / NBRC 102104 / LLR-40K-21) TaxID=446470 RepID=D3PXA1_STANL|nr:PhzF family phenazine biosynthesis isomerase [Stackebrandtia nassauensis]ADD41364.1 phenazine biosynthesis protein PhzF family [Stackebrandtia nassauensis DSM 44728]